MIATRDEAEHLVAERFGSGFWLYEFPLGWVVSFSTSSDRERTPSGVPANPGTGHYVLDKRTGEFVPQGSLHVAMIAKYYQARHGWAAEDAVPAQPVPSAYQGNTAGDPFPPGGAHPGTGGAAGELGARS